MRKFSALVIFGLVLNLITGCGGEANPVKKGEPPPTPPAGPGKTSVKSPKSAE